MGPVTLLLRGLWAYWIVTGHQAASKKTLDTIFNAIVASAEVYIVKVEGSARLVSTCASPPKSGVEGGDADFLEGLTEETRLAVLKLLSDHLKASGASRPKGSVEDVRKGLAELRDVDAGKVEAIMHHFNVNGPVKNTQTGASIDSGKAIQDYAFVPVILEHMIADNVLPGVEIAKQTVLTGAWDHQEQKIPGALKDKFAALLELSISAGLVDIPEIAIKPTKKKGKEEKLGTQCLVPVALKIRGTILKALTAAWIETHGCAERAEEFLTGGESFHGFVHPLRQAKLEQEEAAIRAATLEGVANLQKQVRRALRERKAKELELQLLRRRDQRARCLDLQRTLQLEKEERVAALWTAEDTKKVAKHGSQESPVDHWGLSVKDAGGNPPIMEDLKHATLLVYDLRFVAAGPRVFTIVETTMVACGESRVDRVSFVVNPAQRMSVYAALCEEAAQTNYPTACTEYTFGPSQESWTMSGTVENAKRHPTLESLLKDGQPVGTPAGVIITVLHADARQNSAYLQQFQRDPGFNPRFAALAKIQNPIPGFATGEIHRFEFDMSMHWADPQDSASNGSYPAKDFPSLYALANWFFHHADHDDFCVVLGSEELAVVAAFQSFKLRYLYPPSKETAADLRAMKLIREMRFLQHECLSRSCPNKRTYHTSTHTPENHR